MLAVGLSLFAVGVANETSASQVWVFAVSHTDDALPLSFSTLAQHPFADQPDMVSHRSHCSGNCLSGRSSILSHRARGGEHAMSRHAWGAPAFAHVACINRLLTAFSVGAVASIVAAFLSSFTEPVINRVLVRRLTISEAMKEVRLRDCLGFFETALATNLVKFPFFEVVSVVVDFLPIPSLWRGVTAGAIYSTVMVPVSNFRYRKSMQLQVAFGTLYEAYWPTTWRDIVYGLVRMRCMQALMLGRFRLFGSGQAHLAACYFSSVFLACVVSAPLNELRAYSLQRKINAKKDGGGMSFAEFFQPERFIRSTILSSFVLSSGVGFGALVAPTAQIFLVSLKSLFISMPMSGWEVVVCLALTRVLCTKPEVFKPVRPPQGKVQKPAYDPYHRPRMIDGIGQLTDAPVRLNCDSNECRFEEAPESTGDAVQGDVQPDGDQVVPTDDERVTSPLTSTQGVSVGSVSAQSADTLGGRIFRACRLRYWFSRRARPEAAAEARQARRSIFQVFCGRFPALSQATHPAAGMGGADRANFLTAWASTAPPTHTRPIQTLGPRGKQAARILSHRIRMFTLSSFGLMLLNMTMTAVDKAFVGRVSSLELAAMGAAGTIFDCCSFLVTFMNTALISLLGQALADRKAEQSNRIISHALVFTMGISILLNGLLLVKAPELARFVGAKPHMVPIAAIYLRIRALGGPIERFISLGTSICIANQDGRTPLLITLMCAVFNICGNWLFCYKLFPASPAGACAAASTLAGTVSGLLLMRRLHVANMGPRPLCWPRSYVDIVPFLSFAGPVFLLILAKSLMFAQMTAFSTRMGEVVGAAHQVIVSLFFVFSVAVAQPCSWAGQSFLPPYLPQTSEGVGAEPAASAADVLRGAKGGSRGLLACTRALLVVCFQCALVAGLVVHGCLLPHGPVRLFSTDDRVISVIGQATVPVISSVLLYPLFMATEGCLIASKRLGWALAASSLLLCADLASIIALSKMGRLTLTTLWACTAAVLALATAFSSLAFWRVLRKARRR